VRDIDLSVAPGERVLLLGASGAGKSTLLAGIAGVLGDADEGEQTGVLTVDGADPRTARGRVGLVLQNPESGIVLERVGDDVAFGPENLGVAADAIASRVREALDAVGLTVPLDARTGTLSGGQQQRLVLAGVLAMRPGALLLDEPTANLDPDGVVAVREAVVRAVAATGSTLLVVEHRLDVWLDHVDRIVVLGPDGVIADGSPATVFTRNAAALARLGVWLPGEPPRPRWTSTSAGSALLVASDLAVGRTAAVQHGIDLAVPGGATLGVTGPNGAGKSTLALTLGGLLPPLGGRVAAAPELARGLPPDPIRWRSRQLVGRIGTVFQRPEHQFLATTVRAELAVGPRAAGVAAEATERRVDRLLAALALAPLADANPFTLSGGEQRRLSVATALAAEPAVLVLDEPTFGQDARTWAGLVDLLLDLVGQGTALVAATHDLPFLAAMGARRLQLHAAGAVVRA
jgi:energy-coupling factor transport system ATP-binding protein